MHPKPIPHRLLPIFTPWRCGHGLTGQQFESRLSEVKDAGYRLVDLSGCWDGSTERFSGIWEPYDGIGWRVNFGLPLSMYQGVFNDRKAEGFRPLRQILYATPAGVKVCVLWSAIEDGPDWEVHHGLSRGAYQDEVSRLKDAGYRPVDVTGYEDGGLERYAAVWEMRPNTPAWEARHHLTDQQYQAEFLALGKRGYVLDKVVGYTVDGQVLHAATWTHRSVPAVFSGHAIDDDDYQRNFDDRRYQGYRPRQVAAYSSPWGVRSQQCGRATGSTGAP